MSLVGRRIRRWNNEEAVVLEVAFDAARLEWVALVRFDGGILDSWDLSGGALVIEHPPTPYIRPPPTSIPGRGE